MIWPLFFAAFNPLSNLHPANHIFYLFSKATGFVKFSEIMFHNSKGGRLPPFEVSEQINKSLKMFFTSSSNSDSNVSQQARDDSAVMSDEQHLGALVVSCVRDSTISYTRTPYHLSWK